MLIREDSATERAADRQAASIILDTSLKIDWY